MSRIRITQMIIAAVIFILFFAGTCYYIDRQSEKRAEEAARNYRIVPQQEWPRPLVDILEDAKQQDIRVDGIMYWCDYTGIGYWVSEASPEFFAIISERLELQPVEINYKFNPFRRKEMPTRIKIPSRSNDVCYYLNPNLLAGEKNDQYGVMFDKANKVVVIYYYFNW